MRLSPGMAGPSPHTLHRTYNSTLIRRNLLEIAIEVPASYWLVLEGMFMLHDVVMSRTCKARTSPMSNLTEPAPTLTEPTTGSSLPCSFHDRRRSDRLPFPAEMVMVWNYDLNTTMRYRVIDAGDGGYRIHSSLPMLVGTTGMVLRLLPSRGQQLDQPVMVAWTRARPNGDGYDIGLRCF